MHGQGSPLFDVVCSPFPLTATASPTLRGALKDGFGEVVAVRDIPRTIRVFKRFLWAHKETDLAPHPIVGLKVRSSLKKMSFQSAHGTISSENQALSLVAVVWPGFTWNWQLYVCDGYDCFLAFRIELLVSPPSKPDNGMVVGPTVSVLHKPGVFSLSLSSEPFSPCLQNWS